MSGFPAEGELLLRVIPLAMGAAFTPSLLALQILNASSEKWRSRTLAFAAGSAIAFFLACSVFFFGFLQLPHHTDKGSSITGAIVWLLGAAALFVVTLWLFYPHPGMAQRAERRLTSQLDRAKPWEFFGIAFLFSIKDVTSFALLLPALHESAQAHVSFLLRLMTALFVFALALTPVLMPPLWRTFMPRSASRDLTAMYRFTMDNQFRILGVIAALFCVYCTYVGLGSSGLGLY